MKKDTAARRAEVAAMHNDLEHPCQNFSLQMFCQAVLDTYDLLEKAEDDFVANANDETREAMTIAHRIFLRLYDCLQGYTPDSHEDIAEVFSVLGEIHYRQESKGHNDAGPGAFAAHLETCFHIPSIAERYAPPVAA